jgi:predicted ATPase
MCARVSVRNIGPIKSADVSLAPLSILVGPNNAGKSMMSTLLYASTSASSIAKRARLSPTPISPGRVQHGDQTFSRDQIAGIQHQAEVLIDALAEPIEDLYQFLTQPLVKYLQDSLEQALSTYTEEIESEIERCFGSKIDDLVRSRQGRRMPASIVVSHSDPPWTVDLRLRAYKPTAILDFDPDVLELVKRVAAKRPRQLASRSRRRQPEFILNDLVRLLIREVFDEFPTASYYLPAARSGVLQSHRALAAAVVRSATYAGIEDMQVPRMSGVISDFIGQLLEMQIYPNRAFEDEAQELEGSVLNGTIHLEPSPQQYPEISYEMTEGQKFPLYRTSSMVSELAPVILYLRYLLRPGDLVIIEEPESHLHPESQIRMAQSLIRLVNRGLSVALTTHSDFFLQQLNNAILADTLKRSGVEDQALPPVPTLDASAVVAYLFDRSRPTDGTIVRPIRVSPRHGISDRDFSRVTESLYLETIKLDRKLADAE